MSRVENWTYLLSKEVVNHWLNNQEAELPSFEEAIALLGLTGGVDSNQLSQNLEQVKVDVTLLQELEKLLSRIQENYSSEPNSLEKLLKIESVLFNWYYGDDNDNNSPGCLQKLELKSRALRVEIRKNFQDFTNSIFIKSSPNAGFNYLSQIRAFLFSLNDQYFAERQSYILQENGGKKSYNVLVSKIIKSQTNEELNSIYDSGINALFHIYKCKIKVEIADLASHIIRGIIPDSQLISDSLIQSSSFLGELQNSFSLKEPKSKLAIAEFFDEMCLIKSPDKLKQEVENDLGIPLNRWRCGYISLEEINKILLLKVAPIAQDIFGKLAQEFAPEPKLKQQESQPFQLLTYSNTK